jgi:CubicO group peptidase (beta-lactamase class C family)
MKTMVFLCALALTLNPLVTESSALAAGPPPTRADALAAIAAYAPQALKEQGAPGMAVAVTDATHVLQLLTLGYADVAAKQPVTAQTRFPIGSITKSMTALSLMQLADSGALDLGAPVKHYLPDFLIDSAGKPILVHQLLSHTAGIPDDFSVPYGYGDAIYNLRDASVLSAPGTSFSYSNDGYVTAGAILASLDARPWSESVQRRVLDPIGMAHTSPVFTPDVFRDTATGYTLRYQDRPEAIDPPLVPTPPFDFVDPAGSVISTPEDMAAYMRFYLNGGVTASGTRLISQSNFQRMTMPDDMNGKPAGASASVLAEAPGWYQRYGFGLTMVGDGDERVIAHTGGISGYTACMAINMTRGFGVIAMSNLVEAPLHPCAIVLYAMSVLRAQSLGQPLPKPPVAPDPAAIAHAEDYAGTYRGPGGAQFVVKPDGSGAVLGDGKATFRLYSRDDDQFWTDDPRFARFLLVFYRNKDHVITDFTAGPEQFVNAAYRGASTFSYPARYDALVGRYEQMVFGDLSVTRVIEVRGQLTFDGTTPLVDQGNGTFRVGHSVVRFDHEFGGKPQRMWVDDIESDRIDLP